MIVHTGAKTHFLSRNSLDFGSEFCDNWDFRNVNFVEIGILEMFFG